jgi:hypothetical protein
MITLEACANQAIVLAQFRFQLRLLLELLQPMFQHVFQIFLFAKTLNAWIVLMGFFGDTRELQGQGRFACITVMTDITILTLVRIMNANHVMMRIVKFAQDQEQASATFATHHTI